MRTSWGCIAMEAAWLTGSPQKRADSERHVIIKYRFHPDFQRGGD